MRVWFTVCVMFAVACGKGDAPAKPPCCKVCKVGRPCGDTCIPASQSCTTAPGCACSAAQPCCKICGAQSKPCGDTCIALDQQCHTAEGCACDRAAD